jgi:hypothetical protein
MSLFCALGCQDPCLLTSYKLMREVRESMTWNTSWQSSFSLKAESPWYRVIKSYLLHVNQKSQMESLIHNTFPYVLYNIFSLENGLKKANNLL